MSSFFTANSTAEEVLQVYGSEIVGKNILITGASSGIGAESARVLAKFGANVWLAGRDLKKTKGVADSIAATISDPNLVHTLELDLSDLSSVKKGAAEFLSLNIPLHILLNNAGCMAIEQKTLSVDGFEMQLATNHLGHFVFTNLLIPALLKGAPSRIVNLSSKAHWRSGVSFEDPNFETTPYEAWKSYGQSKTANILHAVELAKKYTSAGITSVSLHPGVIETELWRHAGTIYTMNKTIPQGAATSVFCVVSPTVKSGLFYDDCKESDPAPYASSSENAEKLWELSLKLTNKSSSDTC